MSAQPAYDEDFFAWTQDQARRLREAAAARANLPLDFENLAEEIESMGKGDLRGVTSALTRILEHLLKLEWSPRPEPRAGWFESVMNQRDAIGDAIEDSPSLSGKIDLPKPYSRALRLAARGLAADGIAERDLPDRCPYTLDQILSPDWWPANRHGITDV